MACALAGCGGGGGGGDGAGSWLTFDRLEVQVTSGVIQEVLLRATATRDLPSGPYLRILDPDGVTTGTKVSTISSVGTALGAMAVASDGARLYAMETGTSTQMRVVDLVSGAVATGWQRASSWGDQPFVIRPNGVDVVLVNDGTAYRASDGALIGTDTGLTDAIGASADGTFVATLDNGYSPATVHSFFVDYSDQGSGALVVSALDGASYVGECSNGQDVATSADGATVFMACGAPYSIVKVQASDLSFISLLSGGGPYPSAVERSSDGRIFAITGSQEVGNDRLLVYGAAGGLATYADLNRSTHMSLSVLGDGMNAAVSFGTSLMTVPVGP